MEMTNGKQSLIPLNQRVGDAEMDRRIQEINNIIKKMRYRHSRARDVIIQMFVEQHQHLTPEKVYQMVRNKGISRPTVYRNLEILKESGIIKEMWVHHERVYELYQFSQKKLHVHFFCMRCGTIKEYSDRDIFRQMIHLKDYIEMLDGDSVEDITIVMSGVGKDCVE